jgi:aminoglycoside phosphotransferase (APT) family kinase protein
MDVADLIRTLAPAATFKEISAGGNRVFRLLEETGATTVLKVYQAPSRERRERHALESLAGTPGVPAMLDRGITDGAAWIRMTDGGTWNLASLPKNIDIIRRAGRLLRGVHDSGAKITNLGHVIGEGNIEAHYRSTLERLERFRRRLQIDPGLLGAAARAEPPSSGPSKVSHTKPTPEQFLVNEAGQVTLIDWEWATLAPPEWDVSLAIWQLETRLGQEAGQAFSEGYGITVPELRLSPWVAYHAAMMMLNAAENREGRLHDLAPMVNTLASSVGYRL